MKFIPFYFDANQFFGTIDSTKEFHRLLGYYDLETVLDCKMAQVMEIDELPKNYHMGSMGVRSGDLRSFGLRREHIPGTVTLEDWAKNRGMDLRKLAETRAEA